MLLPSARRKFLPALLIAGILAAGCGTHPEPVVNRATPTPKPARVKGYVRVADLIARSPLQTDVARLRRAEERLRRLAQPGEAGSAAITGGDLLSPLDSALTGATLTAADEARAVREERITSGGERLRQNVNVSLDRYAAERKHRQQQLISQRRVELEATGIDDETKAERDARDAAYALALSKNGVEAESVPRIQSRMALLSAQIGYSDPVKRTFIPGTLPPVANDDNFKQQVAAVTADPKAKTFGPDKQGIGMFARLLVQERTERAKLKALRARLLSNQSAASLSADMAAADVAQKRLDEIERKLDDLSDDSDLRFQLRDQQAQLAAIIAAQSAASARAEAAEKRTGVAGLGPDGAGSLRLADIFGPSQTRTDRAGAANAADRVAHQRMRLQQFIVADVKTAVQDAARERNLDVILVSNSLNGAAGVVAGRRDMTGEFVQWTMPGSGGVIPMSPVKPGWPIIGGGAVSRPGG